MGIGVVRRAASRASCAANRPSREQQRADARMQLAADHGVAARRSAALWTLRGAEMSIAARIARRGGPDGSCHRSARGLARLACFIPGACSGPTRGRSWRRATGSQLGAPRLCGRSATRRYV